MIEQSIDLNNLSLSHIKKLNQIIITEKTRFNLFFDMHVLGNNKEKSFLLSGIATRDINLNSIYETLCIFELLKEEILSENYAQIIVQNYSQKLIFENFIKGKKIKIKVYLKKNVQVKEWLSVIYQWLSTTYLLTLEFIGSKVVPIKTKVEEKVILLTSFLLYTSFDKEGEYVDNYYRKLREYTDKKNIYYLFTLIIYRNYFSYLKKIKKAGIPFILRASYLKLFDYLVAAFFPFSILKHCSFKDIVYNDVDVSFLFNYELIKTSTLNSVISANLQYSFIKRLKERKVEIELIVDWFENQLISRAVTLAVKEYYPEVKITGYLGSIPPDSYIHLFPSEEETNLKLVPEKIFVTGNSIANQYRQVNEKIDVRVGPAFRYSPNKIENLQEKERFNILVALPFELNQLKNILILLKNSLFDSISKKIRIIIKPHPMYGISDINRILPELLEENFEFTNESISQCFSCTDLLLSSNSSACLEAIASGIPVIVICSTTSLTHIRIPQSVDSSLWALAYDRDDLMCLVTRFYLNKSKNYSEVAMDVRMNFFQLPTRENVNQLFTIDKNLNN